MKAPCFHVLLQFVLTFDPHWKRVHSNAPPSPTTPASHLQSSSGILEEQRDGAVVSVLSTPQLAWPYLSLRREGWVMEQPQGGEVLVVFTSDLLVGVHKELRILGIQCVMPNVQH